MIKRLDQLILRAFIGPFLATFLLSIFVLILQFFWLWIDDFIGKGIDTPTLLTVIMYVAGSWVPVALPLAMLLSTIMTFGKLGETYELVAIKSAGISLRRFMRPIFVVSLGVCGLAFLFNNNIIPVINLKLNKLKYEIVYTKPAFDIKPGIFYDKIEGYIIKLGKKGKNGEDIEDILIYEKGNYLQDNLIVAAKGKMSVSKDKRFLEFDLQNGTRYEEKGMRNDLKTDLTRVGFEKYKKVFDLTSFFQVKTSDSLFKDNYRMLSMRQLDSYTDTLRKHRDSTARQMVKSVSGYFRFLQQGDSGRQVFTGTIPAGIDSLNDIIADSAMQTIADMAISKITSAKSSLDIAYQTISDRNRDIRHYQLEWQRKLSLSFACFVLFLIGAPLGAIIRKGGLGAPLVFAVIFFVVFHLLNTVGEKLVKEGVMPPFWGMWLSTMILLPIGFFLTYKAMRDAELLNKEYYLRLFKQSVTFINGLIHQVKNRKS